MCDGVEVRDGNKAIKVNFVAPAALVPVLLADDGAVEWIRWGRRKKEQGVGPVGGWARQQTMHSGNWDVLNQQMGFVLAQRFIQESILGRRLSQWVHVPPTQAIACVVIGEACSRSAYIVTTMPPPELKKTYSRWPLLVDIPEGCRQRTQSCGCIPLIHKPETLTNGLEHWKIRR